MFDESFEIISLTGTLSAINGHHLHASLSNKDGQLVGGYVFGEMNVFRTAEITIGEILDMTFKREMDPSTNYEELVITEEESNN